MRKRARCPSSPMGLGQTLGLHGPSGIDHLLDVPVDLLEPMGSRGSDVQCLWCRSGL